MNSFGLSTVRSHCLLRGTRIVRPAMAGDSRDRVGAGRSEAGHDGKASPAPKRRTRPPSTSAIPEPVEHRKRSLWSSWRFRHNELTGNPLRAPGVDVVRIGKCRLQGRSVVATALSRTRENLDLTRQGRRTKLSRGVSPSRCVQSDVSLPVPARLTMLTRRRCPACPPNRTEPRPHKVLRAR